MVYFSVLQLLHRLAVFIASPRQVGFGPTLFGAQLYNALTDLSFEFIFGHKSNVTL